MQMVNPPSLVRLVLVLRGSGKRTLGRLNAFDFVVTLALGSTLAASSMNTAVSWSEGVTALAVLAIAQFLAAFVSSRVGPARGRS